MTDSVEASLERDLAGHPSADPVAEAAVKRIEEIARRHEEALRAAAASSGVSLADCQVIFELAHADPAERTPSHLAKAFHITAGSVTARLGRLEAGGFLTRTVQPDNRAQIRLTLTEKGHAMHDQLGERIMGVRSRMLTDALPAKDLAILNRLLRRVLTHMEASESETAP
ncbi:MarR family winged helix-turn-helix transcriptional regulator [Fodinicola acaciae]|uniref:MarR family winged helix-turn-helix transcriptional regulator n=1 Tax=Fodinicola acaciae TaxID=2681555 RepID=UPI0013D50657|nr:MarR family transcriptional regulator [Fodinicola acaciae]